MQLVIFSFHALQPRDDTPDPAPYCRTLYSAPNHGWPTSAESEGGIKVALGAARWSLEAMGGPQIGKESVQSIDLGPPVHRHYSICTNPNLNAIRL